MSISASVAAAAAGTGAIAAYLNGKYHIGNDLQTLWIAQRVQAKYNENAKLNRESCFYPFENAVNKYPDHELIWSREGYLTSQDVFRRVCQYADFFLSHGVRPGDLVAIYMRNSPDLITAWIGLWAIGCAPTFINYNLSGDALVHCLKVSQARLVLVDNNAQCHQRIIDEKSRITNEVGMEIVFLSPQLKAAIYTRQASRPPDHFRDNVKASFPGCVFYTSGTTGFPKGATFATNRMHQGPEATARLTSIKTGPGGDSWYVCMPMYHGTAGFASIACMLTGTRLAIGKEFSVRNFWRDVHDSQATILTYVGETARYLLAAPPNPLDRGHKVRAMFGNGLRPDVWRRFQERFGVAEVWEFFNSSEGVLALFNLCRGDFRTNCIGHNGAIVRYASWDVLVPVEVDRETEELVRDPTTGFAKRRSYEEGGEIIVKLNEETDFTGYIGNPKATRKKLVFDVFKKGDIYWRSGDALRRCPDGRWYFMDRLGDTFRWKSENVSTAEVAQAIGLYPGIDEANVYGVQLPDHEGRAGCAALSIARGQGENFDWSALVSFSKAKLPKYAVPVFIRVLSGEVGDLASHNNKQSKVALRAEGVEPEKLGTKVKGGENDQILFLKPGSDTYIPFTEEEWKKLVGGRARL